MIWAGIARHLTGWVHTGGVQRIKAIRQSLEANYLRYWLPPGRS